MSVTIMALGGAVVLSVVAALVLGGRMFVRFPEFSRLRPVFRVFMALLIAAMLVQLWIIAARPVGPGDWVTVGAWGLWSLILWSGLVLLHAVGERFAYVTGMERHRAKHDALTSLPNRGCFAAYLDRALGEPGTATPRPLSVLVLDLNRFKAINDQMGHAYGDILLKEIALRLHRSLRKTDMLARLGGDEFGVIVERYDGPGEPVQVARHLVKALTNPFAVQGNVADIGVSIGLARYPEHGRTPTQLLKRAKLALAQAKRSGIGLLEYDRTLIEGDPDNRHLLMELHKAIAGNRLEVHYQPQLDLASEQVDGFEALVRWRHPSLGLLSPDEFLPLAEESGMIEPLIHWVLDQVLDQLHQWRGQGVSLPISTNVSPSVLVKEGFDRRVMEGVRRRGLVPARLILEVTESSEMADTMLAGAIIRRLVDFGISVAIDDFGTGFASLDYLKKLPVTGIKLDKSFVLSLKEEGDDAAIVRATIDLAHKLDRTVTAEGVESKDTLDLLTRWGCDRAQGYFVGEPAPIGEAMTGGHRIARKES